MLQKLVIKMGAFALCYNGWYIKFFLPAFYGFYF